MLVRAMILAVMLASPAVAVGDIVASRTLRVGTILEAADLRGTGVGDQSASIAELVGQEVRRAIYAGRSVATRDLGPPTLIRRNEIVTMTYRTGGLGLRTQGRSLASGGLGEMVEVMNLDSRLMVRGRVVGPLQVEVSR